jgi:hypothetical protein
MCTDDCTEEPPTAWSALRTTGTPCTALPEGKFNIQNTTLAAAAHQSKAAQVLGQSFALAGADEICNMTGL